jgi:hypothetical protein
MQESKRRFFVSLASAAGLLAAKPLLFGSQGMPHPQPIPSPNAPNQNYPPGLNGPDIDPKSAKPIKKQNQDEIKSDVAKLSELVSDLKSQVERIDSDATLSLSMVKKAQQIEKLAKQIKDLAKG